MNLSQCAGLHSRTATRAPCRLVCPATAPLAPSTSYPSCTVHVCARRSLRTPAAAAAAPASEAALAPATTALSTSEQEAVADSRAFAVAVASVLNDTKCQDIVVLDVSPLVSWTSVMVFGSVFSKPQLMAALARVDKMSAERFGRQQQNTPGSSPWECLDYGDVLVHVMSVEQREFYDLEGFYGTAEEVELPFEQEGPSSELNPPVWARQQPVA